jgi:hypothetical protein
MFENRTVETAIDMTAFRFEMEWLLEIPGPDDEYALKYKQPYAFFTPDGERLETKLSALVGRVVFLFEGGQFIWPGVRIGHKRTCWEHPEFAPLSASWTDVFFLLHIPQESSRTCTTAVTSRWKR